MNKQYNIYQIEQNVLNAYADINIENIESGYYDNIFLVSITFRNIHGGLAQKKYIIDKFIEAFYDYCSSYMIRSDKKYSKKPILIGALDKPVFKYNKNKLHSCNTNDGLHFHCTLLIPTVTKKKPFEIKYYMRRFLKTNDGKIAQDIDIKEIHYNIREVTSYVLKNVNFIGNDPSDNLFLLPKSISETT